jgi:hypothetical protein
LKKIDVSKDFLEKFERKFTELQKDGKGKLHQNDFINILEETFLLGADENEVKKAAAKIEKQVGEPSQKLRAQIARVTLAAKLETKATGKDTETETIEKVTKTLKNRVKAKILSHRIAVLAAVIGIIGITILTVTIFCPPLAGVALAASIAQWGFLNTAWIIAQAKMFYDIKTSRTFKKEMKAFDKKAKEQLKNIPSAADLEKMSDAELLKRYNITSKIILSTTSKHLFASPYRPKGLSVDQSIPYNPRTKLVPQRVL